MKPGRRKFGISRRPGIARMRGQRPMTMVRVVVGTPPNLPRPAFPPGLIAHTLLRCCQNQGCVALLYCFPPKIDGTLCLEQAPFYALAGELERKIKGTIRSNLTARHVPARVIVVGDIPFTRSGKKVNFDGNLLSTNQTTIEWNPKWDRIQGHPG